MRAWAEDSLSVADTQSRIMALTANEERATDQVSKLLYEYGISSCKVMSCYDHSSENSLVCSLYMFEIFQFLPDCGGDRTATEYHH